MPVRFSARNQLQATVKSIKMGSVMAEITLELSDGQQVVSTITGTSAENLHLKEGDSVFAMIKSTEVIIGKDM